MITTGGELLVRANVWNSGAGTRVIVGGHVGRSVDAVQVAISWVCLHAPRLRKWLGQDGPGSRAPLFTREQEASLAVSLPHLEKKGQSTGTCVAVAFMCWLVQCPSLKAPFYTVTGRIDLRGRVLEVGRLPEKATHAKDFGMDLMVVPSVNLADLDAWRSADEAQDEWASGAVTGAATMVDVMEAMFPGACPRHHTRGLPLTP
jgi:ATP-dependent Lon protease